MQLLGELRQAIDRRELTLVYQPKFDAHTTAIVGVEALLRWRHPDRGLLSPEEFMPTVRQHGLMGRITDLVVNRALDDALLWHTAGVKVPVAVNLFPPLLSNLDLPSIICQALADRGLEASALTVEITEDRFVDDMERTQTVLNELVQRGIRIAIDDFGTGYSAFSYLSDLPIDEVKLDHDFIARALIDGRAAIVVSAVIDLAHKLGLVPLTRASRMPEPQRFCAISVATCCRVITSVRRWRLMRCSACLPLPPVSRTEAGISESEPVYQRGFDFRSLLLSLAGQSSFGNHRRSPWQRRNPGVCSAIANTIQHLQRAATRG